MKKIVFCGGGSAGHVIPNIAIIEELKGAYGIYYIGTRGIEKNICKDFGVEFRECDAAKYVRGKILCNLSLPYKLIKSVKNAGKILDGIKPDMVFCKGGFACVPTALAAKKRGIPVVTHESDLTSGLANKFIAKKCEKVLTSFPQTAKNFPNGIYTGSPMRKSLFGRNQFKAKKKLGLDMRPTLLVLGGGSGSRIINENIRKIAAAFCKKYNILHVCGRGNLADVGVYGYKQIEFTDDMGQIYACADFALSRCGSNSANELIALKIPTLFIPLENRRSRGDQVKNAEYFESLNLCRVLRQKELSPQTLLNALNSLWIDESLKNSLKKSSLQCGNEKIIREITGTLKK